MKSIRKLAVLCFGLGVAVTSFAQAAATTGGGPFSSSGPTLPPQWGHWSDWSVSPTQSTSTGISRSGTGNANVNGAKVPMGVRWTATKRAVSVAGAAAAAACGTTLVGAIACQAAAQYAVYKGIEYCYDQGWCRPAGEEDFGYIPGKKWKPQDGAVYFDTPQEACGHMGMGVAWIEPRSNDNYYAYCGPKPGQYGGKFASTQSICMTGYILTGTKCIPDGSTKPPMVASPPPWDDPGFVPWLDEWQGQSPGNGPDLAQDASDRGHQPQMENSPDVSGQPGPGPSTETSGEQPNPDPDAGCTDTVVTHTTRTVTPNVSNNGTPNASVTYTTTTTTTRTVTNCVTGQTSTSTETSVETGTPPDAAPTEFPKDYNKEVTQQQILKEIAGEGAGEPPPDQGQLVETAKTQAKTDLDALRTGAETMDQSSWFSWVWTPPSGSCSAFAGEVHGFQVSWDVCPTVANIREALGWLFAIFAAIDIYGQLFRREG